MAEFVNPFAAVPLHDLLCAWEEAGYDTGPPDEHADEGWWLFHSDTYGFEIERDDEAGIFASDDAARAYVEFRARLGSPLHQQALAIHEAQEAGNRTCAEMAGYTVEPNGFGSGWFVHDPEGEELPAPCATETAAWSAAWRDLLERGGADD